MLTRSETNTYASVVFVNHQQVGVLDWLNSSETLEVHEF